MTREIVCRHLEHRSTRRQVGLDGVNHLQRGTVIGGHCLEHCEKVGKLLLLGPGR